MTGPCIVAETDNARREIIFRVLEKIDIKGIVDIREPCDYGKAFNTLLPPRLALVAVRGATDMAMDLISQLRVTHVYCLLIAIDAADTEESAALPFSAGAHDVLRLPLRAAEVQVRIARGLGRLTPERAQLAETTEKMITRLNLTNVEAKMLRILSSRHGQIVTRDELSQHLYGTSWTYGDRRFDVHVTKIRRKLRDVSGNVLKLRTIRSAGYTLEYAATDSLSSE